jgi:hypothetical protein
MIYWEHSDKKSGLNGMASLDSVDNIRIYGISDLRNCRGRGDHASKLGGLHLVSDAGQA